MSPQEFQQALQAQGLTLSTTQMQQFGQYLDLLIQTNKVMNLTNITEPREVYVKHFYDSATPLFFEPRLLEDLSLADIGSGAGFPGIVLKIINPNLKLTIVDSLQKRIKFLEQVVTELGLTQVTLVHARAEEFARQKDQREAFDYVTARAVAKLSVLLELCLPVVKVQGTFIALKGIHAQDEVKTAQQALKILDAEVTQTKSFELPEQAGQREILFIQKQTRTPKKYPRKPGTPAKEPLE
ncbi:16S rRNA (guanine(527)-N(7))-methyltransferase RsmG [Bombilactobacillus folatiphilus]|uniref:Ribosomal RNA small subunit methyltransferase G n=1 Tax=Bombilactobacillus folatiphilus TaxID=2923362 RepID=A0ABY4P978_9LACO|nr:16S rRNA (guanine(527)-N(7))-methyltransferase RsmG [Bombilactobacillus folatiphilus]UQS82166.1 16S rRNA (guanine(527)-N(7))-methyltransferase RsmG [Bombilactobacillus folatiphilus]